MRSLGRRLEAIERATHHEGTGPRKPTMTAEDWWAGMTAAQEAAGRGDPPAPVVTVGPPGGNWWDGLEVREEVPGSV